MVTLIWRRRSSKWSRSCSAARTCPSAARRTKLVASARNSSTSVQQWMTPGPKPAESRLLDFLLQNVCLKYSMIWSLTVSAISCLLLWHCMWSSIFLQIKLEEHLKNVENFDALLKMQMEWLASAEKTLSSFRQSSKLYDRIVVEIQNHQVWTSPVLRYTRYRHTMAIFTIIYRNLF